MLQYEALQPLGEGQRVGFVGLPGLGKSAAARIYIYIYIYIYICRERGRERDR